jgi:von Willebrand factor type A domain/Aerotolerance regulator N-terminal
MNILWLNSYLFPFIALALLPLLLHLFAKTKPKIYKFSSNMFIIRSARKNMKLKRPFDILLLILRTLLFLAVIVMFLQPLLFLFPDLRGLGKAKTIILIVDASASMGGLEDGRTRFATACSETSEILSGLSRGDKANIIWLKASPNAEFPLPGSNFNYLQNILSKKSLSYEAGNSREALKLAFSMLKDVNGRKEICIISDFQATQWQDTNFEPPLDIKVSNIKIGKKLISNLAVTRIISVPSLPLQGEVIDISCEIRNFSPEPRSCTVFFKAEAARQNQKVMIPAWGTATPLFKHIFTQAPAMPVPVKISISEDEFSADNSVYKLMSVKKTINIAISGTDEFPGKFWIKAINALPFSKLDELSKLDAPLNNYDIIFLSGWNGTNSKALKKFMEFGKTVICAPARKLTGKTFAKLIGQKSLSGEVFSEKGEKNFTLKLNAPDDKLFKIFSSGEFGDPTGGEFKSRNKVDSSWTQNGKKLISYQDGVPALTKFKVKSGTLFLWNISLNPLDSYWAYRAQFLPIVAELILGANNGKKNYFAFKFPGQRFHLKLNNTVLMRDLTLTDAGAEKIEIKKTYLNHQLYATSIPIDKCGVFNWKYLNKIIALNVVNFPPSESDLRSLPKQKITTYGISAAGGHDFKKLESGQELWPMLLCAVIALLLLEGLIILWSKKKL